MVYSLVLLFVQSFRLTRHQDLACRYLQEEEVTGQSH